MTPWNPLWSDAISNNESGGRYGLLGPTTRSGDRAYGKYQVMGNNIGEWTQSALGRAMSPQEFLQDPDAQEAVFKHQFGSYVDKYGSPQDAASAWFSGRPLAKAGNASDVLGTTVPAYVSKFNKYIGGDGVSAINNAAGIKPTGEGQAMAFAPNQNDNATATPPPDYGFMGSLLGRINGAGSGGTYDLGDAMGNAGASMMALGNPQGAAVLAAINANNRKAVKAAMPEWKADGTNATFYRTNPQTGKLETMANPNAADDGAGKAKLTEGALKHVGETVEKYDYLNQSATNAQDILGDLESGKLDLGMLKNWSNSGRNMAGISDEQSRSYAKYNQFIQSLVNDNLRLNKGVQTEGDAYRELKSLASNGTMYDNETAKEALKRSIAKSMEAVTKRGTSILDSHKAAYGAEPFAAYDDTIQGWKNNAARLSGVKAQPNASDEEDTPAVPAATAAPATAAPSAPATGFKIMSVRHPKR